MNLVDPRLPYLRQSLEALALGGWFLSRDEKSDRLINGQACYYMGMRKRRTGPLIHSRVEEICKNVQSSDFAVPPDHNNLNVVLENHNHNLKNMYRIYDVCIEFKYL